MKKLLAIVASALTLGAFADAGNTPMTFELPEGLAAGTQVTLVCNGEAVHTTTATSDSITYSTEGLAAGEYWLELAGEPITESVMIGTSASAPQFASAKYAEGDNELIIAEGTLEDPIVKTAAELAGKAVTIKSGCALKIADVASGVNQVWTITGQGSDSYLVLASNVGYGFNNGSKFNNLTMVVEAGNVWIEDRASDVYGESVNLWIKSGAKVTFANGEQLNPYVVFGSIKCDGSVEQRNNTQVFVANTIDFGEATVPSYISKALLWDNTKNAWASDTTSAGGTAITSDHTVVFDGFENVLYYGATDAAKIRVHTGTLKIGHNGQGSDGPTNLPSGSVVTIAQNAEAMLCCWNYDTYGCNTSGVYFPGVTFNGPGKVKLASYVKLVSGSFAGTAQLDVNGAEVATVADGSSVSMTITGSGTIPYVTGMSLASDWTGTVKAGSIDNNGQKLNLNVYGNAGSKVEIDELVNFWIDVNAAGALTVEPTIILKGKLLMNDMSSRNYTFKSISGNENAVLEFGKKAANSGTPTTMTISKLADFAGTIKNTMERGVVISTLVTSLEAMPENKTKIVSIDEGTTGTISVSAATLADGTAIDSDKISVEEDGIYVLGNAPTMPEAIEGGSTDQQTAYVAWAAEVGIDDPTVTGASEAFALSLTAEKISAAESVEDAVEKELDSLLAQVDLSALSGEGGVEAAVAKLNSDYPNATFTLKAVSQDEIETTAMLFRLSVEFNAKGQN